MTAVLAVLGMIGKVLLILLLILLVLLALILFFPVTYKADIQVQDGKVSARAAVSWLFRFVYVRAALEKNRQDKQMETDVRIAGIRLLELLKKRKKKKSRKKASGDPIRKVRKEAPKKPTVQPGSRMADPHSARPIHVEVTRAKYPGLMVRIASRITAFLGKIRHTFRKIAAGTGILLDWLEYLGSESFETAKTVLMQEGKAILQHILPRKLCGNVLFGTADPAKTGMILGVIGVLYPVLPGELQIEPDFTESVLETDLHCKGHIVLIVLIVRIIRIVICRDVRLLISRIRKELHAGKKKKEPQTGHKGRKRACRKTKKTLHFRTT